MLPSTYLVSFPTSLGKFNVPLSSYHSCLMALQKFHLDHQEYDFIYNWEMDVRYIGNYLDFFEGIEGEFDDVERKTCRRNIRFASTNSKFNISDPTKQFNFSIS